jgi:thioredoxin 1
MIGRRAVTRAYYVDRDDFGEIAMNRRLALALIVTATFGLVSAAASAAGFATYSGQSFDQALKSGAPLVVHVHADWCPTCRAQMPTLQSMSGDKQYDKVRFVRVNFDKDRDFLTTYKVASQSTILVFKGGKEVARFAGVTDATQIKTRIGGAI